MTENRQVRPWDIFNKNLIKVQTVVYEERINICKSCPNFIGLTTQCSLCGCPMKSKAKLPDSKCPIQKWDSVSVSFREKE
jgi:hypothetical protein